MGLLSIFFNNDDEEEETETEENQNPNYCPICGQIRSSTFGFTCGCTDEPDF